MNFGDAKNWEFQKKKFFQNFEKIYWLNRNYGQKKQNF